MRKHIQYESLTTNLTAPAEVQGLAAELRLVDCRMPGGHWLLSWGWLIVRSLTDLYVCVIEALRSVFHPSRFCSVLALAVALSTLWVLHMCLEAPGSPRTLNTMNEAWAISFTVTASIFSQPVREYMLFHDDWWLPRSSWLVSSSISFCSFTFKCNLEKQFSTEKTSLKFKIEYVCNIHM